jgi:hypothetical protein
MSQNVDDEMIDIYEKISDNVIKLKDGIYNLIKEDEKVLNNINYVIF